MAYKPRDVANVKEVNMPPRATEMPNYTPVNDVNRPPYQNSPPPGATPNKGPQLPEDISGSDEFIKFKNDRMLDSLRQNMPPEQFEGHVVPLMNATNGDLRAQNEALTQLVAYIGK